MQDKLWDVDPKDPAVKVFFSPQVYNNLKENITFIDMVKSCGVSLRQDNGLKDDYIRVIYKSGRITIRRLS